MAVKKVDDATFSDEVLSGDVPVVVDFWAEWCGPCKAIAPYLEEISEEMAGDVKIVKLNVDENFDAAGTHGISALPTLVVFHKGQEIARHSGATSKSNLSAWIKGVIG